MYSHTVSHLRRLLNQQEQFQFVIKKKSLQKVLICVLEFEGLKFKKISP